MQHAFWQDKRVLITGHTGFKGAWLCIWLKSLGAKVTGFSLPPPSQPNLFEVAQVSSGMTSIIGDIRDTELLKTKLQQSKPEIIMHLAAQSLLRYSYEAPIETYTTNVIGTANLLDAARHTSSVKSIVIVTSDKCYENQEWDWGYRENDAMGGFDPYSSSKGCVELVTAAYRTSYFNPEHYQKHGVALASARAGNVIGGGDWAKDRLIPDIIRAIHSASPIRIRNPHSIRPWQHVLEPLSGYLLLAQKLYESGSAYAEGWNFGPQDEDTKSVKWIVNTLYQIWGSEPKWDIDENNHPHEARFLKLDCSKAKNRLSWYPKWSLQHALEKTWQWDEAYRHENDMHALCLAQIKAYEDT